VDKDGNSRIVRIVDIGAVSFKGFPPPTGSIEVIGKACFSKNWTTYLVLMVV
jgi:hypothetical protein